MSTRTSPSRPVRAVNASGFADGFFMIAVAPEADAVAARGVVLRSDRC